MKIAPVSVLYEANFHDIPRMLDKLKADVAESNIKAVVTIHIGYGGIDVRGMGECDTNTIMQHIVAAHHFLGRMIEKSFEEIAKARDDG